MVACTLCDILPCRVAASMLLISRIMLQCGPMYCRLVVVEDLNFVQRIMFEIEMCKYYGLQKLKNNTNRTVYRSVAYSTGVPCVSSISMLTWKIQ